MRNFTELLANRQTGLLLYIATLIGFGCIAVGIPLLLYSLVTTTAIYFLYPLIAPLISGSLPPTISLLAAFGLSALIAIIITVGKAIFSKRK